MYNREKAVAFAKAQIGKPYQWAGNGDPGFDCSGLVRAAVIAGGGPVLPHQSGAQVADDAVLAVSPTWENKKLLLPGDIVFWYGSILAPASVTHCGFFIGKRVVNSMFTWQCVAAVDDTHGVIQHRMNWALAPSGFGLIDR